MYVTDVKIITSKSKLVRVPVGTFERREFENKHNIIVTDINTFFEKGTKIKNDSDNKKREDILESIDSLPENFLTDTLYGDKWTSIRAKWNKALSSLCTEPFDTISVTKKGGRGHNYDFFVSYKKGGVEICSKQLEFKFNSKSIYKLAQFIQLTEYCGFIGQSYAEYYYNNYLSIHCDIVNVPILEKEKYLKFVKTTSYDSDPFFVKMKQAEENTEIKKKISALVAESIKTFLEKNGSTIDLLCFTKRIKEQEDKIFILWDGKDFISERLEIGNSVRFKEVKNNNMIVLEDLEKGQVFNVLLRWKNHKGVLNPAWQIAVRKLMSMAAKK